MFRLALSAGHGLKTPGKRCLKKLDINQTREWVLNDRICRKIEQKLQLYPDCVVLRVDDVSGKKDVSLKKRTDAANAFLADFYLSVHHNAGIKGGNGGGIETYVYTKASDKSHEWQEALYDALIKFTALKGNRADGTRSANLHECRESDMPCVLLECGYMDSATDVPIILTDEFAQKVSDACVDVIIQKSGMDLREKVPTKQNKVLHWQKAAIKDGFKFPLYGADGTWGQECESVAKNAVCKKRIKYKYKNLTKIVQKAVGVTADGKFGAATHEAVKDFQRTNHLTSDGCVGINTWKKILEVK